MRGRQGLFGVAAAIAIAALPATVQSQATKGADSAAKNGSKVTLIGCVQLEKDYRADLSAKKGGPLGSGLGQGNEYVLVKAKPAPTSGERQTQQNAVATAGEQGDYLLTGKTEDGLKLAIGREVEVVGTVEPFRPNKNAAEARDRLPRLAITAWHPVKDYCPASATAK
jgi:hypothetical protein